MVFFSSHLFLLILLHFRSYGFLRFSFKFFSTFVPELICSLYVFFIVLFSKTSSLSQLTFDAFHKSIIGDDHGKPAEDCVLKHEFPITLLINLDDNAPVMNPATFHARQKKQPALYRPGAQPRPCSLRQLWPHCHSHSCHFWGRWSPMRTHTHFKRQMRWHPLSLLPMCTPRACTRSIVKQWGTLRPKGLVICPPCL